MQSMYSVYRVLTLRSMNLTS